MIISEKEFFDLLVDTEKRLIKKSAVLLMNYNEHRPEILIDENVLGLYNSFELSLFEETQ